MIRLSVRFVALLFAYLVFFSHKKYKKYFILVARNSRMKALNFRNKLIGLSILFYFQAITQNETAHLPALFKSNRKLF